MLRLAARPDQVTKRATLLGAFTKGRRMIAWRHFLNGFVCAVGVGSLIHMYVPYFPAMIIFGGLTVVGLAVVFTLAEVSEP